MRMAVSGRYICLVTVAITDCGDGEAPALLVIEQGGEHAGRVEARTAEPVDGAVGRDQRGGLEISDEAVLCDLGVAHESDPPLETEAAYGW